LNQLATKANASFLTDFQRSGNFLFSRRMK
jgi:hypothetical protein